MLHVAIVHRTRPKPLALAKCGLDAYGDFGSLELGGLVVCFRDGAAGEQLWEDLKQDPTPVAYAYAEVCCE
jgi:hypothetical protein